MLFSLLTFSAEGLEDARDAIADVCELSFNNIHASFVEKLFISRRNDEEFFEKISAATSTFNAPLEDERIETTFNRDGERVTEVVHIGDRLALFKKSIEKDAAKLESCWAEWEELQGAFMDLGAEIFGPDSFEDYQGGEDGRENRGYTKQLDLLNLEQETRKVELIEEIEEIKDDTLQETNIAERVNSPTFESYNFADQGF